MWLVKGLLLIWIACGAALLGYGLLESIRSWYVVTSTEAATIDGTIVGSSAKVSQVHHAGGHIENLLWFPQPVVEWKDMAGVSHQSVDPNIVPYFWYEAGQKVSLKVYLNGADPAISQVFVNDYYTRFAFPVALVVLGVIFLALSIIGWTRLDAAGTAIVADLNTSPSFLPFELKYFLWGFFALAGFAAFMTLRPFLKDLLPDTWNRENDPPPPVEEKKEAAPPPSPPVAKLAEKQTASAGNDSGPDSILDARTGETRLMQSRKNSDADEIK